MVEGTVPPCMNVGMVWTIVARVGPPLVGSELESVCAVTRGPLGLGPVGPREGISSMTSKTFTSPLPTIPP